MEEGRLDDPKPNTCCKTRWRQRDGVGMHGVTRQKQQHEFWSVERKTFCSDEAKCCKADWTARHSSQKNMLQLQPRSFWTDASIARSEPNWAWPSLDQDDASDRETHKQTTTKDVCRRRLEKHHRGGSSAFGDVPDFRQSLPAEYSQQNIHKEPFISSCYFLSNYFRAPIEGAIAHKYL